MQRYRSLPHLLDAKNKGVLPEDFELELGYNFITGTSGGKVVFHQTGTTPESLLLELFDLLGIKAGW